MAAWPKLASGSNEIPAPIAAISNTRCCAVAGLNRANAQESLDEVGNSETEVVGQVRLTVIHEVGHHLGIDDARLGELGW